MEEESQSKEADYVPACSLLSTITLTSRESASTLANPAEQKHTPLTAGSWTPALLSVAVKTKQNSGSAALLFLCYNSTRLRHWC